VARRTIGFPLALGIVLLVIAFALNLSLQYFQGRGRLSL